MKPIHRQCSTEYRCVEPDFSVVFSVSPKQVVLIFLINILLRENKSSVRFGQPTWKPHIQREHMWHLYHKVHTTKLFPKEWVDFILLSTSEPASPVFYQLCYRHWGAGQLSILFWRVGLFVGCPDNVGLLVGYYNRWFLRCWPTDNRKMCLYQFSEHKDHPL